MYYVRACSTYERRTYVVRQATKNPGVKEGLFYVLSMHIFPFFLFYELVYESIHTQKYELLVENIFACWQNEHENY